MWREGAFKIFAYRQNSAQKDNVSRQYYRIPVIMHIRRQAKTASRPKAAVSVIFLIGE
jgi:hypothetical protein